MNVNLDLNGEYYVLERENKDIYPRIRSNLEPGFLTQPVDGPFELTLDLFSDLQPNSEFTDYHALSSIGVVSDAFKKAIDEIGVYGAECVKGTDGDVIKEHYLSYHLLHVYNWIKCIDIEKSDIGYDSENDMVDYVERFALDSEILIKIPEDKRQIFRLKDSPSIQVIHEKFMNQIKAYKLNGYACIPINKWNDSLGFD